MRTNYIREKNMKIDTTHEIVGKLNSELGNLDIDTLYPVLDANLVVIGVADATDMPYGYYLDKEEQAYREIDLMPLSELSLFDEPVPSEDGTTYEQLGVDGSNCYYKVLFLIVDPCVDGDQSNACDWTKIYEISRITY